MTLLEIVPARPAAPLAKVEVVTDKPANSVVRRKSIDELRRVTSREVILGKMQDGPACAPIQSAKSGLL